MLTLKRIRKGLEARVSRAVCKMQSSGDGLEKQCNSCGKPVARFYSYGGRQFGCPFCQSSPRERLVIYCLDNGLLTPPGQSILHVAPSERGIIERFGKVDDYYPADLFPDIYPLVPTKRLDLMELNDADRFDVVYLSHVMEHVPDDARVLENLFRALRPGGQGWFLVPLWSKPSIDGVDLPARERERRFGQWDHVRQYGPDFVDRIAKAGFETNIIKVEDFPEADRTRLGLNNEDWVFRGTKPA